MIDDQQPVSYIIELFIESRLELKLALIRQPELMNLITCVDYNTMTICLDKSMKISEAFPLVEPYGKTCVCLALAEPGLYCYVESGWARLLRSCNKHVGIERPLVIYVTITNTSVYNECFIISEECSLLYLKIILKLANMRLSPYASITILGYVSNINLENSESKIHYYLENGGSEYFPESEEAIKYYFDDINYNSLPISQLKFKDDYSCKIDFW